jgi:hypothetical protein
MAIGASTLNIANINAIIGQWAVQLADMSIQVPIMYTQLFNIGLAGLQAAPYNLSSTDAQNLLNLIADMQTLVTGVYNGSYYITSGTTVNSGVPTANSAGHFGYNFSINISKGAGIGF